MLNDEFLELLRCPIGKDAAKLRQEGEDLVCPCGTRFAIVDEVPNLLIEDATLPPGCPSVEALNCPHAPAPTRS